ncbi:Peptidase family M13 containing protein [Trichostrongylus colubriformis]|uniref:Peptidase family M13 containing protein n=1 Tax=Trichostrongylus colubriformis TaxID=6319 RepID=A0AAN8IGU7_TRICO
MFDGNGIPRDWWKKKWTEEYDKRALCYKEQYDNIKIPKFNISLNGTLTLGENIADNEGMKIAFRAYKKYAAKLKDSAKSESVDGFTQDQLFFLGLSQMWCRKTGEFAIYERLSDVHPPPEIRVDMAPVLYMVMAVATRLVLIVISSHLLVTS